MTTIRVEDLFLADDLGSIDEDSWADAVDACEKPRGGPMT
jgi:hypothetical protein